MSFVEIPADSDFTLANIPFGIFSTVSNPTPRACTAIGDYVLDLSSLSSTVFPKVLEKPDEICEALRKTTLNAFAALGKTARVAVRNAVLEVVKVGSEWQGLVEGALVKRGDARMHLPMDIGDYTDFYAGKNHAFNVGVLFRGPANALQPNYTHLPVGYHGRASTVVVSGTPLRRPLGQTCPPTNSTPNFDQCNRLDIELEMACYVSRPNEMGHPIDIKDAEDHIFGYSLMNDWSARDIQAWEYVPLGPFNAKNFGTTVGGWIVTDEALEGFRTAQMEGGGEVLPYLRDEKRGGKGVFDVELEVLVKPAGQEEFTKVFTSNSKNLLFSFSQMIAHHTITGCAMRTGDLLGSGTISGADKTSVGSYLEATQGGKEDIEINGVKRKWLEDGDEVVLRGHAGSGAGRVGFGECSGLILPAEWGRWSKIAGAKKDHPPPTDSYTTERQLSNIPYLLLQIQESSGKQETEENMAILSDTEHPAQQQQLTLTLEQATALEAAMAEGSLRGKKRVTRGSVVGEAGESLFKPGYEISSAAGQGFMSPRISPGQKMQVFGNGI
ncbi:hypothetical protein TWF481_011848 [Arthrobotrys musiformis]|uniref:fumarylacetoacetase n=1 Tax=Arthrobotrys musiformis TaxID=47236 RepID=A0AAV9VVC5_9PEZI